MYIVKIQAILSEIHPLQFFWKVWYVIYSINQFNIAEIFRCGQALNMSYIQNEIIRLFKPLHDAVVIHKFGV